MTTNVTLHAGHDVAYFTRGQEAGGCAGAMSYYTASGEPPGQWAGTAARKSLGLTGQVDAGVLDRLFMKGIGPDGEILAAKRPRKDAGKREEAAVAAYRAAHPYASAVEIAEVRAAERGRDPHTVPYFDLTVSAVKSVSVLHASYRTAARQARDRGEEDQAAALDAKAQEIEDALIESAREAVGWLEQHATYTRTGHHSARTGEWRDGDGLAAALFLHHISRDGDPQLHVHVAIWNRVQRADGADEKWRTLDSRTLHNQRLAVAATTDRLMETRLTGLGYVMVPRGDGNGAEVGGVGQDVMDTFSSRAVAITGELRRLAAEYEAGHGTAPSRRTLWLLHQQAGQNTRRTKTAARRTLAGQTGSAEPTDAERLAAWEAQTTRQEIQALSQVHAQVAAYAAEHRGETPVVLDDAAKRKAARIAVAEVQRHHAVWSMAQLRFEVHRALPVLPAGADADAVITEVADLAVSGRAGTGVVCVTAPDVTDVTSLGVRASDGGSIYRPPHEDRYSTLEHLDTEEHILTAAKHTMPQAVDEAPARAAVTGTGLNGEQAAAVVTLLTATTMATVLIAPAGAGKSHTVAAFAGLWELHTGRRVIGLATSTNAARVLAGEGLAESYNIAEFLGKTEGSDELRRPVPLDSGDVLVIDEATQASTADLAMLLEAARMAGARVVLVGDTQQLGSPEAGGMFRLLAGEVPAAELTEVRRFRAAMGSRRLGTTARRGRQGDRRLRPARPDQGRRRRSRPRASRLGVAGGPSARQGHAAAGRVQRRSRRPRPPGPGQAHHRRHRRRGRRLPVPGTAGRREPGPSRGPDPRPAECRDRRRRPQTHQPRHPQNHRHPRRRRRSAAAAARRHLDREVLDSPLLPAIQRRTRLRRQRARRPGPHRRHRPPPGHRHPLPAIPVRWHEPEAAKPTPRTSSPAAQPRMGTSPTSRPLPRLCSRTSWNAMPGTCRPPRPSGNPRNGPAEPGTSSTCGPPPSGPPCTPRSTSTSPPGSLRPKHGGTSGNTPARPSTRHCAPPIWPGTTSTRSSPRSPPPRSTAPGPSPASCTAASSASTSPTPAPLRHGRSARPPAPCLPHANSRAPWTTTRANSANATPPTRSRGSPATSASWPPAPRRPSRPTTPAALALLPATGKTPASPTPEQAVSPEPHRGNPELEHQRQETIRVLEIADEAAMWAGMDRGQLEAHQAAAERAQATAPPDVASQLRSTAYAEADARQQAADARIRNEQAEAASASALAGELAAERQQLEAGNAKYEAWAAHTRTVQGKRQQGRRRTASPRPHPAAATTADPTRKQPGIRDGGTVVPGTRREPPGRRPCPHPRAEGRSRRGPALATPPRASTRARGRITEDLALVASVRSRRRRPRAVDRGSAPGRDRHRSAMASRTPAPGCRPHRNRARKRASAHGTTRGTRRTGRTYHHRDHQR